MHLATLGVIEFSELEEDPASQRDEKLTKGKRNPEYSKERFHPSLVSSWFRIWNAAQMKSHQMALTRTSLKTKRSKPSESSDTTKARENKCQLVPAKAAKGSLQVRTIRKASQARPAKPNSTSNSSRVECE